MKTRLFSCVLALSIFPGLEVVLGGEGSRTKPQPPADEGCCCETEEPRPDRLTSRPRPTPPAATPAKVGEGIETGAGQRRRLALPDGSVLFVNENTSARLDQARALALTAGEVYVEATAGKEPFTVKAPKGEVSGQGASFAVRPAAGGTGVLVTRGHARVSGLDAPLSAGQQLMPGGPKPAPAPRVSHLLDWTRELMAAAESPLVPASQYAGGALVAIDPNGQEAKLSLRKYHVDVFIEDGFARTTIDQTYFNQSAAQMEGTFYFPLPPDASVSHLAMYVNGTLMEAGMVERDHARQVYETIRYQQRDPALLEWVDGSTFKMRVFPIEGRQEKRVLLSYTQKLDALYGRAQYRHPTCQSLRPERECSFTARVKGGAGFAWNSTSHHLWAEKERGDLVLRAEAIDAPVAPDVVLAVTDPVLAGQQGAAVRFSSAEQEGQRYLMLRFRPDLLRPAQGPAASAGPRSWVFLFESSGDRDPLLARVQVEVVRNLLAHLDPADSFNVVAAGTRPRAWAKAPQPLTPENVQGAVAFLEGSHLVGALDLGAALAEGGAHVKKGTQGHVVHVGSGVAAMGEHRDGELARKLPEGTRYVGVGVGKRWARGFMKSAAERTGGYFTQVNPDEPLAWRCFELFGTLQALSSSPMRRIEVAGSQPRFLAVSTFPAAGEEFCAVARLDTRAELPQSVSVRFGDGEVLDLPVQDVRGGADYLPRTWARLEIERLLAEDAREHKDEIVRLSMAMYVMTPFTSLLVLENDDMYVQYKVERGRKDHWAAYPCPKKIEVVTEPDPDQPGDPGKYAKKVREVAQTIVVRDRLRILKWSGEQNQRNVTALWEKDAVGSTGAGAVVRGRLGQSTVTNSSLESGSPDLLKVTEDLRQEGVGGQFRHELRVYPVGELVIAGDKMLSPDQPYKQFIAGSPYFGRSGSDVFFKDLDGSMRSLGHFGNGQILTGLNASSDQARSPVADVSLARLGLKLRDRDSESLVAKGVDQATDELFERGALPRSTFQRIREQSLKERVAESRRLDVLKRTTPAAVPPEEYGQVLLLRDAVREDESQPPLLYRRPGYSGQDRIFCDLVAYAPGLNTSAADVDAVLEAEVRPNLYALPGHIDADVRPLFEKARSAGWRTLTLLNDQGQPALAIDFDGRGRFASERLLPPGLRERVVCDGAALLHLYPQLGLAARRDVSRFHRDDLAALVPWFVPPPEDLARGADLKLVGPRTVAVVPHGADAARDDRGRPADYARLHLVFAEDGALAEQQVVRMPKGEVLYRQVCTADGTVRLLDGAGKELHARRGKLASAHAPDLSPDTKDLVVLSLPYRTPEHVRAALKIEKKGNEELRFAEALRLLTAEFASGRGAQAEQLFRQALHAREQRQLGLYVLLAACGQNLDGQALDVQAEHPDAPLAQYLALHSSPVLRQHASQWAVASNPWPDPLLQHLALSHALYQRWQNNSLAKASPARLKAERQKALKYVRKNRGSAFGWAMLCLLQDRAGDDREFHAELAEGWLLFDDRPALAYAARYEHARSLSRAGQGAEARKRFRDLYEQTLARDLLPAIDGDCRAALLGGADSDGWTELMRSTAARLIRQKHRPAVLALARQCWQLDDRPLANHLLSLALAGIADAKERTAMTLAGVVFLRETAQLPEADRLLGTLLADPKLADQPGVWRLAAGIAEGRDQPSRGLECLEKALALEYRKLPEVVDLEAVRRDYGKLLQHYQGLADAMVALKLRPPEGFLTKVVGTADRWRALDPDAGQACEVTARVLRSLGERQLGWDYQTTPIGRRPNEAGPWLGLAQDLGRTGELELADLAYRAAFEAEPTNAQVLWDRAQNLRRAGRAAETQQLLRQIVEGRWQPRFQALQSQARLQLAGP